MIYKYIVLMKIITFGISIERAGPTDLQNTIAIECSVVDEDIIEIDHLFLPGFFQGITKFDKEFFLNKKNILKKIEYKGDLSQYDK